MSDRSSLRLAVLAVLIGSLLVTGPYGRYPRTRWSGPEFSHDEWCYVFRSGVLHAIAQPGQFCIENRKPSRRHSSAA